jgi:hypothetical protein
LVDADVLRRIPPSLAAANAKMTAIVEQDGLKPVL